MPLSKKQLDRLARRRDEILRGGGQKKIDKQHAKGAMSARERLGLLFQAETFQETGMHAHHRASDFGMGDKSLPADGVICGSGYVNGRLISAFSQDFTVAAGTLGRVHAEKIVELTKFAMKMGVPLVAFQDSGGARIQEGVDALSGYGQVFYQNVLLSGVVPQIAVISGPCAGGASYSPALMDFVVITKPHGHMFITGPEVIKAVTGQKTTLDEIGDANVHAAVSGNAHFVADSDSHAVQLVQHLLSYLPANNSEDPPHRPNDDIVLERDEELNDIVPAASNEPLDIRHIVKRLTDGGEFLEVHENWARNIVVGFARIEGIVVGIVANQPLVLAGALDIDASDKAARFIRFCNVFNVPLVNLVDVPGFLPGVDQERGGIIRHGAKMIYAYASATVPKITVILRKAYGGAYLAMCSKEMAADVVYAWPGAEIAVMGAEGAVKILYRKELAALDSPDDKADTLATEYRETFASPYLSASRGYVTDIVEPAETRSLLALSLNKLLSKRESRPAKKHGNIPL